MRNLLAALGCIVSLLVPAAVRADSCPLNQVRFGNWSDDVVPGPSASRSGGDPYGFGTVRFVGRGDTVSVEVSTGGFGAYAVADVFDRVTLVGAPGATPVPLAMTLHTKGILQGTMEPYSPNEAQLEWLADDSPIASRDFHTPCDPYYETCFLAIDDTLTAEIAFQPKVSRLLHTSCFFSGSLHGAHHVVTSSREFSDLPPGAFLVSCSGDTVTPLLEAGPQPRNGLALAAAWPNPSRGEIHVRCALPREGSAFLRLYDSQGRVLITRVVDARSSASRELTIGGALAPGAYFLQLRQGAVAATRQVTVVR